MNAPDRLRLVLRSSTNDDPFVGEGSQYARDIKTFLTAAEQQGGELVRPRLTMDSVQIQTVVEFAKVVGPIVGPVVAAAVTTWLQGRAGRKIRLKVGDVEIEASTPEDFERLLSEARALKATQTPESDAHD
ncbi:hypothetical protein [Paraburkholderia sp. BCC1885]|uniref:hypothetical protein n=1 Tax=Paraburkholderia sp. BCC1885 TaxID=2562669 RepID=UPI001182571D|nr:hypothetical protein [Paraburkholderia sp. BCC1885]